MMIHITDRNELIIWILACIQNPLAKKALQTGTIEVLGAFTKIPPYDYPGWIVKAKSKYGIVYYIGVLKKQFAASICYLTPEHIPWEFWVGDKCNNLLNIGDNPELYEELRNDS